MNAMDAAVVVLLAGKVAQMLGWVDTSNPLCRPISWWLVFAPLAVQVATAVLIGVAGFSMMAE
jgi:hypothetical protein